MVWGGKTAGFTAMAATALLLAGSFVICYLYSANWTLDWLLWKQRYDEDPLGASPLEGITQRAELLVIGLVLTFAALSLVPRRRSWTTRLGGRTFYCYLLHGYVILLLRYQFGVFDSLEKYGAPAVVLTMVVATVVANLLMTQLVATVFRPVFEPRLRWLFRPAPETKPKSSKAPAPTA